tara:strand:+ start:1834 stop:2532 length:699 start_codon:yes stop_codon:yes gene_type:complete
MNNNEKPNGFYVLPSKFKSHSPGYTKWDWIDAFLLFLIILSFFPLAIYLIYKRWSILFRYQQEERKKEEQKQQKKWLKESKERARKFKEIKRRREASKRRMEKAFEKLEIQQIKTRIHAEENLKTKIILLLKNKALKIPASDIDALLKHQNVDEIKALCEEMYRNGEINRTANYRYFVLNEEKKKSRANKSSAPKSEKVDVKAELRKYKEMLDDGLIEKEDYDAKKKKLLGL